MEKNIRNLTFSEYVSPGHPDKVADYISQYILDRFIEKDPLVRYAVEVLIKENMVVLAGEVTSTIYFSKSEYEGFVVDALAEIGYTEEYLEKWGSNNVINPNNLNVIINIQEQSPEISQGVNSDGWGDQGIFFGYAFPGKDGDETMMPLSHAYAKWLCHDLYMNAKNNGIGGLDIKTEIIMDGERIVKVIAAVPCRDDEEYRLILESIKAWYDKAEVDLPFYPLIILNGTGNYVMHGPVADSGVTGRKLAVDLYGGHGQIGGGAIIKDGTKADVSLNLFARKMAKTWATKTGKPIKVSLACCIGKREVDYRIETPCGEVISCDSIVLSPKSLIQILGLDKPIYTSMHMFGLFGKYQTDKAWESPE